MSTHLDPDLAQKIVHEVKFQGVFDEFRKDSIADVDTKPAYLNLRQRVENAVQKFLSEQRWTPDTNKYQLRDRLRRHITESGFLDVGVERIVDQVVNPKIGSVFQPRIEEIAYKYLGLPPPIKREHQQMPPMPYPNNTAIPINGNALKVETEPPMPGNLLPKDLEQVSPDSDKTAVEDEKVDDEEDESPPFEPINDCKSPIKAENVQPPTDIKTEEVKVEFDDKDVKKEIEVKPEQSSPVENETKLSTTPVKDECPSVDGLASQESQLSQVSSDTTSNQLNQSGSDPPTNLENAATANISEEAQMPKFNENSTENDESTKKVSDLHFDIKKDEIKFEGTERKPNILDGEQNESINDEPPVINPTYDGLEAKSAFNFTKLVKVEPPSNTQEAASSVSSQDDTSSAQLCIVEKSEQDTNSLQKATPDESNATTLNNSQIKANDEKRKSKTSSSTSSSRHKKSSKSSRRTPERSHRHDDKDARERSSSKYSSEHHRHSGENRHTSKHHHSSVEKHSTSSSKREEKRSSSSRSESQSRHSSSKKDYRDRHDSKRHARSHKSHRSDKDGYKSRKPPSADDHSEFKEKNRRRKSTDSNDEDKSPSAPNGTKNSTNGTKSTTEGISSTNTTPTTGSIKNNNNNDTSKHSKDNKQKNVPHKQSLLPEPLNINSSMVVVVNEILTDPSLGVVELETKAMKTNKNNASTDEEDELLYFESKENDLKQRLSLLDEAINRCSFAYKAFDKTQTQPCNEVEDNTAEHLINNNNNETEQKLKATLQVDCYQYDAHNDNKQQTSPTLVGEPLATENEKASAAKRFKFDATECGMSKENEMNEKNAIKTDIDPKKTGVAKRGLSLAKQRYTSEDLYKPRPILSQRIKRRGLDD